MVIGVATSGSPADYAAFVERHGLSFPSFDDTSGAVFDRFGIPTTPATVSIAVNGRTEAILGASTDSLIDMLISNAID